ncbi:MAG: alpha-L-fucosidase [Bacteroides sp.]|nr:alpha-L-fucosidase [Bacteroides sp.]MCM1413413.1 alpha-L-fucosidase [Bacteroides sp.]MCM1471376.1 alpha-L-fucosidase [Bacteroides sp.]
MLLRKLIYSLAAVALAFGNQSFASDRDYDYHPTEANLEARRQFRDAGLGIFIHWGIYSMFGQNEWYLNRDINADEYAKAASGFYPAGFNAHDWVKAFKDAGAHYICFTTRHHDGFSMWHTAQSPYNIIDATPFGRDILKEIADECHKQGLRLHLYYSHIDWTRPDYPSGRTGLNTGRDSTLVDWPGYYSFMNEQIRELLTGYGPIGAIWFDGWWDHDEDATPFEWQLPQQYAMIHELQPACLIGNNHHQTPFPGEDIQIFERDLPGENTAGLSGQEISRLPLETCITMNRSWGYTVKDLDYQSANDIIRTLVRTAGKGANLLLNVGPQPDGRLPKAALDRLAALGRWMDRYAVTIRPTSAADFGEQPWGVATVKDNRMYLHILDPEVTQISIPVSHKKIKSAVDFAGRNPLKFKADGSQTILTIDRTTPQTPDYVVELTLK